jgi:hypothetical protein
MQQHVPPLPLWAAKIAFWSTYLAGKYLELFGQACRYLSIIGWVRIKWIQGIIGARLLKAK